MKLGLHERTMKSHDWDFSDVPESEWVACCFYEYARESPTIRGHYHEGKPLECFPGGLHYNATIDGTLQTFPNPFVWASSGYVKEQFFLRPWQDREPTWRAAIEKMYSTGEKAAGLAPAFTAGETHYMPGRACGLNSATGFQRIIVEINWASFTDQEIASEAAKWVKANRPTGIGRSSARGRGKESQWVVKLQRLGVMRLLNKSTIKKMPNSYPDAWRKYGPSNEQIRNGRTESHIRELYKMREAACLDLHQLFPFLPKEEVPISSKSKGGGEI